MVTLLCTVRGCMLPLLRYGQAYRCATGHSFDIARSGYVNLLQPQDRRSRNPGDSRQSVEARRRLFERGHGVVLSERLAEVFTPVIGGRRSAILDVGCGEGSHLGMLAERFDCDAAGVDLSTPAIDLAARRYPGISWVVANADRSLPYGEGSFDVILSITSRRNESEFSRTLKAGGLLLIAVPAADDLIELREAVLGAAVERSRVETVTRELEREFVLESRTESREERLLSKEEIGEILRATYRGARTREMQVVSLLGEMKCTVAFDVMMFRRRDDQRSG